jgi:hypothetical protein
MQRGIASLGVEMPFEKASTQLEELCRVSVSSSAIQEITQQEGQTIEEKSNANANHCWRVFEEGEEPPLPSRRGPSRLYVQVDGGRVNTYQGWKEPKACLLYGDDDLVEVSHQRRELLRKEYVCTLFGVDHFEKLVWERALRLGSVNAKETVILGDGASWIWNRMPFLFPGSVEILDWAHALEHLWDTGKILYGEGTRKTKEWVKSLETLLWDGRVEEVIEELTEQLKATKAKTKDKSPKESLSSLINYYSNNQSRMRYSHFRSKGYHIGSGGIESGIKNLVNNRMKGCGMRWKIQRAERMLHLRAAYLSGRWPYAA